MKFGTSLDRYCFLGPVWAPESGDGAEQSNSSENTTVAETKVDSGAEVTEVAPAAAAADATATAAAANVPAKVDWRERRLADKTRQLAQAREREQALVRELEQYKRTTQPTPAAAAPDIDALANEKARQIAALNAFNAKCDEIAVSGRKLYGEEQFNARVQALIDVADLSDPKRAAAYHVFLETAIDTGNAQKIIYDLGSDPDKADALLALSPTKMALELAKLTGTSAVTSAPKPVSPIGSRAGVNEKIDPRDPTRAEKLSTAEWMARREEQIRARNVA